LPGTGAARAHEPSHEARGIDAFEKQYGYKTPRPIRVAVDGIGVFVNKDNPLEELTMPQVDAIFSKTRKGGGADDLMTWGQLGLSGAWAPKPISLYGRNSASGTYGYFKEHALYKGDFKDTVRSSPEARPWFRGSPRTSTGSAIAAIGYMTSDVKPLKLAVKEGMPFVPNDARTFTRQVSALTVPLHLRQQGSGQTDGPLVHEFLRSFSPGKAKRSSSRTATFRFSDSQWPKSCRS